MTLLPGIANALGNISLKAIESNQNQRPDPSASPARRRASTSIEGNQLTTAATSGIEMRLHSPRMFQTFIDRYAFVDVDCEHAMNSSRPNRLRVRNVSTTDIAKNLLQGASLVPDHPAPIPRALGGYLKLVGQDHPTTMRICRNLGSFGER